MTVAQMKKTCIEWVCKNLSEEKQKAKNILLKQGFEVALKPMSQSRCIS